MVGVVKLLYFVIIFLCLFLLVTNIEALEKKCSWDSECPKDMCRYPAKVKCIYHTFCKCMSNFIKPT
ncbi:unnamed protein product [Lathyrus oleraceus]